MALGFHGAIDERLRMPFDVLEGDFGLLVSTIMALTFVLIAMLALDRETRRRHSS
jgi:hypothetical protein